MNNFAWRCLNRAKLLHDEQRFRHTEVGDVLAAKFPELDWLQFGEPTIDEVVLYLLFIYQYIKTDVPE